LRRFPGKQDFLASFSPAVATQYAAFADHAMTGNQPGHRVVRHGIGHGPHRAWRMNMPRQVFIGHHASRRNTQQRFPHLDLEVRPAHVQIDAGRITVDAREQLAY
jgi:hypothetical protein